VWLRHYDLVPAILTALQNSQHPSADLLAATLLGLADALYEELALPGLGSGRRDPQLVRQHVVSALETGVQRWPRHKRREVVEAFLLLVNRDNVTLKQILQDPHHACFLAVVDVLLKSARPGVMRLLLGLLDDTHAPSAAMSVVGNRTDMPFLRHLLRKIGREPTAAVRQNLKRITSLAWLRSSQAYLHEFDGPAQHAAVRLVMSAGLDRDHALTIIEQLMLHGKPGGRRAAAEALAEFTGAEANQLALKALDDPDPFVQAAVVGQLRRRGVPGSLARLVEMLDSPHMVVRQAARKALTEFTFKRYVASFDMLDEEIRRSSGMLVRKVDPQTVPLLQAELRSKVRTRRLRGLSIVRTIELVPQLEPTVIELLHDEDHLVRVEAALALAGSTSEASRVALEETLNDRSTVVQEAARKSLVSRSQDLAWLAGRPDPRD